MKIIEPSFETSKECVSCHIPKSLNEFGIDKGNSDGRNCYCLMCARAKQKIWYNTPEHREQHRAGHFKCRYGITLEDRAWLFVRQNGKCALCGRTEENYGRSLHIDHIHRLKGPESIRGLLCDFCNGYFLTWVEKFPQLISDFVKNYLNGRPLLGKINESH